MDFPPPNPPVAPAWDLVLAASLADPAAEDLQRLDALLDKPIDWDAALRLAQHHGTSSLLFENISRLSARVPAPERARLRQVHQANIHKSLFLTRELIRILECTDRLGVEVIPYKGVVLSEAYYGDAALRQSGDMDLFVREHDVSRVQSAVRDLGYKSRVPIPEDAEPDFLASGYESTFDSAAGKNLLELQWALQPRYYAVDFDMDGLFARAVTVTLAGRPVKTPSPEDLLIVLSLHAAKHVWGRLIWLRDIAQVLRQGNLNWEWILSQVRELGIERILHITLLLLNRLLGTAVPAQLAGSIQADNAAQALAEQIALSVAAGVSYEEEKFSYFRLMMRLRERARDRLRFFTRLAFTPGPGEWGAVRLPRPLFPVYRVVRLARLAARFGRG